MWSAEVKDPDGVYEAGKMGRSNDKLGQDKTRNDRHQNLRDMKIEQELRMTLCTSSC